FFPLEGEGGVLGDEETFGFIVRGFAFSDNIIEVPEELDGDFFISGVHGVNRSFICKDFDVTSDPSMISLVRGEKFGIDVNGFSGAPAFGFVFSERGLIYSKFAGIVARGGGSTFYIIRASCLCDFLAEALRD
ncbi:MAG: hypothetical protein AB7E21_19325, partial [Pseudodonghicola sp.]